MAAVRRRRGRQIADVRMEAAIADTEHGQFRIQRAQERAKRPQQAALPAVGGAAGSFVEQCSSNTTYGDYSTNDHIFFSDGCSYNSTFIFKPGGIDNRIGDYREFDGDESWTRKAKSR